MKITKKQTIKIVNELKKVSKVSDVIPISTAKAFDEGYQCALNDIINYWDKIVDHLKEKGEW